MENYSAIIQAAFEMGCIADAQYLFSACVRSAFPTCDFRRLELIRFLQKEKYMEGRSLNHVFEMKATTYEGQSVWEVHCRRVSSGKTPNRNVLVDYESLAFQCYLL